MKNSFKNIIKIICNAAIIILLTSATSFAADKVKLRLNWMYYGSHAGFALGFVDGIYEKHGIDIDIRSGNGSSSAHRLVANKDSHFSYGSCGAMTDLASKGAPIKLFTSPVIPPLIPSTNFSRNVSGISSPSSKSLPKNPL